MGAGSFGTGGSHPSLHGVGFLSTSWTWVVVVGGWVRAGPVIVVRGLCGFLLPLNNFHKPLTHLQISRMAVQK